MLNIQLSFIFLTIPIPKKALHFEFGRQTLDRIKGSCILASLERWDNYEEDLETGSFKRLSFFSSIPLPVRLNENYILKSAF